MEVAKKIRGVAKKVKMSARVAVNMHAIGTSFVKTWNVKDAWWTAGKWSEEEGKEEMVEFEAQVTGHEAGEHVVFEN